MTTAAIDPRIDALVPGLAWNTRTGSLHPTDVFKAVIGSESVDVPMVAQP